MAFEVGVDEGEVMPCRACDSKVATFISHESTYYTYIILAVVCLFFGWWSCILLPFVYPLSKAIVIRCAKCDSKLSSLNPFGLPSLKDEVLTLRCGECAVVLSRSYLLTLVAFLALMIIGIWSFTAPEPHMHLYSDSTWEEYIGDCGSDVMLKNSVRAHMAFQNKYENREISWDGYLVKITENQGGWWSVGHAAVLLIKMKPSESGVHADIILSLDSEELTEFYPALSTLDKGSHLRFNGTLITPGNEHRLHHLHGTYVEKLEGTMEIPEHFHFVHMRYNPNTNMPRPSNNPPNPEVAVVKTEDRERPASEHTDVHVYNSEGEQNEDSKHD